MFPSNVYRLMFYLTVLNLKNNFNYILRLFIGRGVWGPQRPLPTGSRDRFYELSTISIIFLGSVLGGCVGGATPPPTGSRDQFNKLQIISIIFLGSGLGGGYGGAAPHLLVLEISFMSYK